MFRRTKEQEPDAPIFSVRAVDDYETLEYRHPAAFLSSAGLVGVRCDECSASVSGPWAISPTTNSVLVPRKVLCESCGGK